MLANLDGVCLCPAHGKCVFEAKTAGAFKSGEWEEDAVPYEYILQIQHYLCVTGYNGAYIAVLIGGNAFKWKYVPRDEELISMLIRTERDFWTLVQDDVPPPLDGSDACVKFLSRYYADSLPKSKIRLPDNAADLIQEYGEAAEQADIFTKQKQKAANLLKQMLGEHEIGTVGDSYIKWQSVTQEKFSAELLKTEQPELYAKYLVKSSHRRFTVKAA
jgi:predicted phage-related endonuclease